MKRKNRLSNCINICIGFLLIVTIGLMTSLMTHAVKSSSLEYEKDKFVVYDKVANWDTVKADPLQKVSIDKTLDGHFIDSKTTGCFFLTMKMLGYDVDIDKFYLLYFNIKDNINIKHEGRINPDYLYQISLIYLDQNNCNISVQDISNKSEDFIINSIKNNYPIITWFGGKDWIHSDPYVIYSMKDNNILMYNLNEFISVDVDFFLKQWRSCEKYAFIYGKYW